MNATARSVANEANGLKFRNIMLALLALSTLVVGVYMLVTSPKTVTIDSKHWDCTDTEPYGIEARCTNFAMKKYAMKTP